MVVTGNSELLKKFDERLQAKYETKAIYEADEAMVQTGNKNIIPQD